MSLPPEEASPTLPVEEKGPSPSPLCMAPTTAAEDTDRSVPVEDMPVCVEDVENVEDVNAAVPDGQDDGDSVTAVPSQGDTPPPDTWGMPGHLTPEQAHALAEFRDQHPCPEDEARWRNSRFGRVG
jgi:hypothetical protein